MATLHSVTEETKLILKWLGIIVGSILTLILFIKMSIFIKEILYPTPPPLPTVKFDKLPQIKFPKNESDISFVYSLNTLSGALPAFPDRLNVFKIVPMEPNLLALSRAQERIAKIGFISNGFRLSPITYQWTDQILPSRQITVDIASFNFDLTSDYLNNTDVLASAKLPTENMAFSIAQKYLDNLSVFSGDLNTAKTKITLLAVQNGQTVPATSLSSAQIIRLDFYQNNVVQTIQKDYIPKTYQSLPIFYENPPFSIMNVFVAGGQDEAGLVEAHFYHQTIDTQSETYPIKSAETAFEDLKNGNGYIASYYGKDKEIQIKNVSLGYFIGKERQDYLMPIAVFEGNNGFFAFVPMVKDDWILK